MALCYFPLCYELFSKFSLSLTFSNLIITCLSVDLFNFILFGNFWALGFMNLGVHFPPQIWEI